jgi:hypothetical protein
VLDVIFATIEPFIRLDPKPSYRKWYADPVMVTLFRTRERSHGPLDHEYVRRRFEGIQRSIQAENNRSLQVELGTDPFGEARRLREERVERRLGYDAEAAASGGKATGSALRPYDMTGGAFDRRPAPVARQVARRAKASSRKSA